MIQTPAEQFRKFFSSYTDELKICSCNCADQDFSIAEKFALLPTQALYIFDWKTNTVPYQRRIKELLGYNPDEFTPVKLSEYIHPDDSTRYVHLVKITNEWARKTRPEPLAVDLLIDYRVMHKNGRYLRVLRQSTIYERCRNGIPKSALNILTNISGIKNDNSVNLSITDMNSGEVFIEDRDRITEDFTFSNRELEIASRLKKAMNSTDIAAELHISRHTVDTHRRNMLEKTNCKNTMELVQMLSRKGVI